MVASDSDDDASTESKSDHSPQPLEMETKDTSPERDEMPRWLRYLPNYERVVNHKTTGLIYPPNDTHSGTPVQIISKGSSKSSRSIACSGGATKASLLKAKIYSAASSCGVDNQPGGCDLHADVTRVRGKRSFTSIDLPTEEVVVGVDKIPTLWQENDMPEAVDRVSYAAEGVNIVDATGRKRRKTSDTGYNIPSNASTPTVSVTEISALLSFSKC